MKSRRHSPAEISAKLERAAALAADGKVQSDIAKMLGVSVMTLHRWRKHDRDTEAVSDTGDGHATRNGHEHADIVARLQMENRQLRRLVTDLLLEKVSLEEAAGVRAA
jgi:putative transposase